MMGIMTEPLGGVVVALTEAPFDDLIGVVEVLVQEGLTTLSFPASAPGLADWVGIYGSRSRIGVHGVRTPRQADHAVADGASFVLSDVSDAEVIAACGDAAVYPMAMTPTEIRQIAYQSSRGCNAHAREMPWLPRRCPHNPPIGPCAPASSPAVHGCQPRRR